MNIVDIIELEDRLANTFKGCAQKIQSDIWKSMADTPVNNDVSYYTHNKKVPHHPSMPYNPPAIDSGALRDSIVYNVKINDNEIVMRVGSNMMDEKYPYWLEFGTEKMKERPYIRPAFRDNFDFVVGEVRNTIREFFKK